MSDQVNVALDALRKVKALTAEEVATLLIESMREARSLSGEPAEAYRTPEQADLKDVYEVTLQNFEWLLAEIRNEAGRSHPCAKLAKMGQKWLESALAGQYPDFTKGKPNVSE